MARDHYTAMDLPELSHSLTLTRLLSHSTHLRLLQTLHLLVCCLSRTSKAEERRSWELTTGAPHRTRGCLSLYPRVNNNHFCRAARICTCYLSAACCGPETGIWIWHNCCIRAFPSSPGHPAHGASLPLPFPHHILPSLPPSCLLLTLKCPLVGQTWPHGDDVPLPIDCMALLGQHCCLY